MHIETSYALLLMAIRPEKREPLMEAAAAYMAAKEQHQHQYRMDKLPDLHDAFAYQVCRAAGANKSEKFPRFAQYAETAHGSRILLGMALRHAAPSFDDAPLSKEETCDANHPSAMLERIKAIYDAAGAIAAMNLQAQKDQPTTARGR